MNAYERHVIHTALQDFEGVTTYSTGAPEGAPAWGRDALFSPGVPSSPGGDAPCARGAPVFPGHLDAENSRAKREQSLQHLARKVAGKVVRYRRSVTLEPMNAYERHVR